MKASSTSDLLLPDGTLASTMAGATAAWRALGGSYAEAHGCYLYGWDECARTITVHPKDHGGPDITVPVAFAVEWHRLKTLAREK